MHVLMQTSDPIPDGALNGTTVVLGVAGTSCEVSCSKDGMTCSQQHMQYINSCDMLRQHTHCEAGCVMEKHADTTPSYMDPDAAKASRPAICLVSNGKELQATAYSCSASETHVRRLCACVKPAEGAAASSSSSSGGQQQGAERAAVASQPKTLRSVD
eukprot:jgi/Chrzof1/3110/Cz12g12110.t1